MLVAAGGIPSVTHLLSNSNEDHAIFRYRIATPSWILEKATKFSGECHWLQQQIEIDLLQRFPAPPPCMTTQKHSH